MSDHDGDIIAAAQEERFTRKKHDFFSEPGRPVLPSGGRFTATISTTLFFYESRLSFERLLLTYLSYAPADCFLFNAMPLWLKESCSERPDPGESGLRRAILFPSHHQSHGASVFSVA